MISCSIHDYFESACVYKYELSIELKNGEYYSGNAQTITTTDGNEFLHLLLKGKTFRLNLEDIKSVKVLTKGAKFDTIET